MSRSIPLAATFMVSMLCICPGLAGTITTDVVCPSRATLTTYLQSGFACTVGPLSFSDFTFSTAVTQGKPSGLLDSNKITVFPFVGDMEVGFSFTGAFSAPRGTFYEYLFSYIGDPRPPVIHGVSVKLATMNVQASQTGTAWLIASDCLSDTIGGDCSAYSQEIAYSHIGNGELLDSSFFAPVSVVDTTIVLRLDGRIGPVSIKSVTSSMSYIPEPTTWSMIGVGLIVMIGMPKVARSRPRRSGCKQCSP